MLSHNMTIKQTLKINGLRKAPFSPTPDGVNGINNNAGGWW